MKIRQGFVSNSSSSSFIILVDKKLTKQTLYKAIGLEKGSVVESLISPTIDFLLNNGDMFNDIDDLQDEGYSYNDDILAKVEKHLENGGVVYVYHISNEDGGVSAALYDGGIQNIETPEFKLLYRD